MAETLNPATFNLDDWALDANLPEESADVYKRADVVSELSALKRQIETHREAFAGTEKTAGDVSGLRALEAEYNKLVATFTGSLLTVYVRAITSDEREALRAAHEERTKNWDPERRNREYGFDLLAAAITAVKERDGERIDVRWDVHQIKKLEKAIGGSQMSLILAAREVAQNQAPTVDADFLLKPSGSETGQD
jgi:hypothetical protein